MFKAGGHVMAEKCSRGNFCIAFLACIHMDTHGHTAILSVVWLPSSRCCSHGEWWIEGPIAEPQRSAQAQAMWYVETAGSTETHNILPFHPREDRKRKDLAINHEITTVHLSMMVSNLGTRFCEGLVCVCARVYMRKSESAHGEPCEWICQPAY